MRNDFLKDLGYKALDSRLKRISDRISHDVRKLYKAMHVEIEPNWYLVFMLLEDKDSVSIAYIAAQLGYAHPSAVMIVKKMSEKGFLTTTGDHMDRRKQLVSLSVKSREMMPGLKRLWSSCEEAILQIIGRDLNILNCLNQIDAAMQRSTFHDRFKESYLKIDKEIHHNA